MNILPVMIIYAVYGAYELFVSIRRKQYSAITAPAIVLVILLIISNWSVGSMPGYFNADAYFNLGYFHMQRGHWDEAKKYYGLALKQDPYFPDANGNLGVVLRDIDEDHEGAAECFERILVNYPGDVKAHFQLGLAHYQMGHLLKAKARFEKVLSLDKTNEDARYNLSIINRKLSADEN
jgi:tetratricopeptide (TPR) repeat protein